MNPRSQKLNPRWIKTSLMTAITQKFSPANETFEMLTNKLLEFQNLAQFWICNWHSLQPVSSRLLPTISYGTEWCCNQFHSPVCCLTLTWMRQRPRVWQLCWTITVRSVRRTRALPLIRTGCRSFMRPHSIMSMTVCTSIGL